MCILLDDKIMPNIDTVMPHVIPDLEGFDGIGLRKFHSYRIMCGIKHMVGLNE